MSDYFSSSDLDDLSQSDEYMEYLMEHSDRPVYNGDMLGMLTQLQEEGYMFEEFIEYFEQVCKEREAE